MFLEEKLHNIKDNMEKKNDKLYDKLKQVGNTAYIKQKMLMEMNVALKLKEEEEARSEIDEAMKKADQKIVEVKNVFQKRKQEKRDTRYQKKKE